ncbi:hypothetical protein, partial [Streptomyces galilaeus]|uniref:hypothetical protein n=1 Tax=Streptomyces galilaeus TaxID=33899 RepID=UPI0038F64AA5
QRRLLTAPSPFTKLGTQPGNVTKLKKKVLLAGANHLSEGKSKRHPGILRLLYIQIGFLFSSSSKFLNEQLEKWKAEALQAD